MARHSSKGPSQRQLRVGEEIRHALAAILAERVLHDPALADASITVTEVRTSPDLRNATVYVMPLAGENLEEIAQALNRAAGHLRGRLGRMIHLKFTPSLKFAVDRSFDEAARMTELLHDDRVARDLEPEPGSGGEPEPGSGGEPDDRGVGGKRDDAP